MSFCFAFLCNDAALSTTAQAAFREDLLVEAGAPHGWGLAYYQAGQTLLRKQPNPLTRQPLDFCSEMKRIRTGIVLGHVRRTPAGGRKTENIQPFRFHDWTFSHVGNLEHWGEIRTEITSAIPDFIRRNIRGSTDSELLFHLFLAFIHDAGKINERAIPGAAAGRALRSALRYVERLTRDRGGDPPRYCCMASNGRVLLATSRGIPLRIARKGVYQNVGQGPDDKPLSYPHLKAVALVGGREPSAPGWEAVTTGAVVFVDHELNIEYSDVEPEAE